MATTVTYKGETIATVDNETKTLQTRGTWVEDDFTLTDVSGGGDESLYKLINGTIIDSDIDWLQVTTPKEAAFMNCTLLTSVDNPTIDDFRSSIFRGCTGLTHLEVTTTRQNPQYGQNVMRGCTSVREITIHFAYSGTAWTNFAGTYFFTDSTALETVIFTVANNKFSFNSNWLFSNCTAFRNMVIKCNTVASLSGGWNANAWGGIYNNPTESTIYVPSALVEDYKTANGWSALYASGVSFSAIEGSIYE